MSEPAQSADPRLRFHQWCEPALAAGRYRLEVRQDVAQLEAVGQQGYANRLEFAIDGPRFALSPTDVYSIYPPKGHMGTYAGTLPHVVLSRRTLPWERTLRPAPRRKGDMTPWLALLVLAGADFPQGALPEVRTRTLADLLRPEPGIAKPVLDPSDRARFGLQAYEHDDELCATIDLPMQLFRCIAPTAAELALLAHVREVDTGSKETACALAEGWFSVVVANRLPLSGPGATENLACLVSLEGLADQLPGAGTPSPGQIRLAVLSSWTFRSVTGSDADPQAPAVDFKVAAARMDAGPLAVPWSGTGQTDAHKQVRRALHMGYTALNHGTRLGERTVSWYRGPLVPEKKAKSEVMAFRPVADAALRYGPEDGMLDVSYAAAFQLGRLLALQSRPFAQALRQFRQSIRARGNQSALREEVQALGRAATATGTGKPSTLAQALVSLMARQAPGAEAHAMPTARPQAGGSTAAEAEIPESVARWLGRLVLLYRVPFSYLVPDARMLGPDSIRFFHLDPNWIKCLLEGACSIGRTRSRDELVDERLRSRFLDLAVTQAMGVRQQAMGAEAGNGATAPVPPPLVPRWPLTGFLVRSPIVAGWQGLEMRAWDAGGSAVPLVPLRIDRLAPDILLCIFNGEVSRVEIAQPPEGLHFGVSVDDPHARDRPRTYRKMALRDTGAAASLPGAILSGTEIEVPMRGAGSERVLDVVALEACMRTPLRAPGDAAPLTSAEFAVQMIDSAARVIFDRRNGPGAT